MQSSGVSRRENASPCPRVVPASKIWRNLSLGKSTTSLPSPGKLLELQGAIWSKYHRVGQGWRPCLIFWCNQSLASWNFIPCSRTF